VGLGNIVAIAHIAPDDVKALVDQMIWLLRQPDPRSRWQRITDWFADSSDRQAEWRANELRFFSHLRKRLDDPAESFDDEAHHLIRWMDWDLDLERQSEEIQRLAPRIQQALHLLERSRSRRPS
jgi:hypothetical protein